MDYKKYSIKNIIIYFLIAILISIFIHLLSCSDNKIITNNNASITNTDITRSINNNINSFNNILVNISDKLKNKNKEGFNNIEDDVLTKTILDTYKKYQDNNVVNFKNVKGLDFEIKNMQNRIKGILNTLNNQYKNHYGKSVLINTNGVITGA